MKILICGVGAIGSNLTARLVSDLKGEHEVTVLDKDVVEERNIRAGTQFYTPKQIGLPKVEALQFNIYNHYQREIGIWETELEKENLTSFLYPSSMTNYGLIIDCFDNMASRKLVKESKASRNILHIGFSNQFTFAIEWNENYSVPTDIKGLDICELPGASAFVNHVSSLGALVAEEFILKKIKMDIVGGKFHHRIIK